MRKSINIFGVILIVVLHSCSVRLDFEPTGASSELTPEQLTVAFSTEHSNPTGQYPLKVVATFSEEVNDFSASDLRVENASVSTIAATNSETFTITLEPVTDGEVTVTVVANSVNGANNQSNAASDEFSIMYVSPKAPSISDIGDEIIDQDTSTSAIAFTVSDADSELDCSTSVSLSSSNNLLIDSGDAVFSGTAPNCTLTLTPNASQFGTSTVTLTVTDGGLSTSDSFNLEVVRMGWYQEAYIKASNAEIQDFFGTSVSLSGDSLAVGARGEDSDQTTISNGSGSSSDNSLTIAGAVYVYRRVGVSWAQEAYIKTSNNSVGVEKFSISGFFPGDNIGENVDISRDTLVVGVWKEDSNQNIITNGTSSSSDDSMLDAGAAYVYHRSGGNWSQQAYIKASNAGAEDHFGRAVAISNDTVVVGARYEDSNQTSITNGSGSSSNNSSTRSGAVYVYHRNGSVWLQQAYIKASNANANDHFGSSLSISGDTLVVAATQEDSNQNVITNGSGSSGDNSLTGAGAVYVYQRNATSWSQQAYIKPSNAGWDDAFGFSTDISSDTISVGARWEDSNQTTITNGTGASSDNSISAAGAVYIFQRNGTSWTQQAYIKASNADGGDFFGYSVSVSGDTVAVGAPNEASDQSIITNGTSSSMDNSQTRTGAVYIYRRNGSTWGQSAFIKASNSGASNYFGEAVSLRGDTLAVGSEREGGNQVSITNGESSSSDKSLGSSGAVYVYRNVGRLFEVGELFGSVTSNSITLDWIRPGGSSVGYLIAYDSGATAPSDCSSGTQINITDPETLTHTESSLLAGTQYSFRICPYDRKGNQTDGMVYRFTTGP